MQHQAGIEVHIHRGSRSIRLFTVVMSVVLPEFRTPPLRIFRRYVTTLLQDFYKAGHLSGRQHKLPLQVSMRDPRDEIAHERLDVDFQLFRFL